MPYETLVGLAITFISTLMFSFFGFAGCPYEICMKIVIAPDSFKSLHTNGR